MTVYQFQRRRRRRELTPSPIFLAFVAICAVAAYFAWQAGNDTSRSVRFGVFIFVIAGWIITLCFHEFGHAMTAWQFGDKSAAERGYLTLNPAKYLNTSLSIVLPVLFVLLGGIGLPGAAVYVNHNAIRGRLRNSLVSAAGPVANLIFAILFALVIRSASSLAATHGVFYAGLAYLGYLQVTAALLNLIPVPGLDGYGIVEPWLTPQFRQQLAPIAQYGIFILFIMLWIPPINQRFFNGVSHVANALGIDSGAVYFGQTLFRFWTRT